jgi:hypothetical protein
MQASCCQAASLPLTAGRLHGTLLHAHLKGLSILLVSWFFSQFLIDGLLDLDIESLSSEARENVLFEQRLAAAGGEQDCLDEFPNLCYTVREPLFG